MTLRQRHQPAQAGFASPSRGFNRPAANRPATNRRRESPIDTIANVPWRPGYFLGNTKLTAT
jgi:hypothetical protein